MLAPLDMTITAADGLILKGTLTYPRAPGARDGAKVPLAVLAHQYPATRDCFSPLVRDLTSLGVATLAFDLRGHGASIAAPNGPLVIDSPRGLAMADFGEAFGASVGKVGFGHIADDIVRVASWGAAQNFIDGTRLLLVGGSVGGTGVLLAMPRLSAGLRGVLTFGAAGAPAHGQDAAARIRAACESSKVPLLLTTSQGDPFDGAANAKAWSAGLDAVTTRIVPGDGHAMAIYFAVRRDVLAFVRRVLPSRTAARRPGRGKWLPAMALGLLLLSARTARADDSCVTARNGACDEMKTCGLGTDATDCAAACAAGRTRANQGVCAHYDQAERKPPPPGPDTGSHGSGGPGGMWGGNLTANWTRATTTRSRNYTVYVPRTYDPRVPTPLVLYAAGNGVDQYQVFWFHELQRAADLMGFILVTPGQPYVYMGYAQMASWIIYKSAWESQKWPDCPDVDFVKRLINEVKGLYNIDRTRIFATGHSRGAALSIILAFELPDLIAGFASQMGFIKEMGYEKRIQELGPPGGRFIPGMLMHGELDDNVPYAAGEFIAKTLTDLGWTEGENLIFHRFKNVGHDWQRQLNQQMFDFLYAHPLPLDKAAP